MFQGRLAFTATVFVLSSIVSNLQADQLPTTYPAELIRVIDGDTVKLKLTLYPGLFKEVSLRVAGIDTPESRNGVKGDQKISQCEIDLGKQAKQHAKTVLEQSAKLWVTNIDPAKTKYAGRINGKLWFLFSGLGDQADTTIDYGLYMIKRGLAKSYRGGNRAHWPCQRRNSVDI